MGGSGNQVFLIYGAGMWWYGRGRKWRWEGLSLACNDDEEGTPIRKDGGGVSP